MRFIPLLVLCSLFLAGCEQLGLENPAQIAAAKEAEGRAVGGACRHSGRALEDCYTLNPKALKAAVFSGWRDMDAYMRENNIETVTPLLQKGDAAGKKKKVEETPATKEAPPAKDAAHSKADAPLPPPGPGGKMV